jgi:hypothetical protein
MAMSAFEVIFLPVLLTTLGSCMAGAVVLGLTRAIGAFVESVLQRGRSTRAERRGGGAEPGNGSIVGLSRSPGVRRSSPDSRILSKS